MGLVDFGATAIGGKYIDDGVAPCRIAKGRAHGRLSRQFLRQHGFRGCQNRIDAGKFVAHKLAGNDARLLLWVLGNVLAVLFDQICSKLVRFDCKKLA